MGAIPLWVRRSSDRLKVSVASRVGSVPRKQNTPRHPPRNRFAQKIRGLAGGKLPANRKTKGRGVSPQTPQASGADAPLPRRQTALPAGTGAALDFDAMASITRQLLAACLNRHPGGYAGKLKGFQIPHRRPGSIDSRTAMDEDRFGEFVETLLHGLQFASR
jgi:hypothetical protein